METTAVQRTFQLRGSLFTLSVLQLLENDLEMFAEQLQEVVTQAPKFFDHAPIVIDLQYFQDKHTAIDFGALVACLREYHLIPVGVRGGIASHHQAAKAAGLAVLSASKHEEPQIAQYQNQTQDQETQHSSTSSLLITKPVRSGQQIYAKGCDLVVSASVSQGAELLADGHIHVYGALRGRALAGISGNTNARIYCQSMEAELISIAGYYIVYEALIARASNKPHQIFLQDGKLQIQTI